MPLSILKVSKDPFDGNGIQKVITEFMLLKKAIPYLNTCRGGTISVTDNLLELTKDNQKLLRQTNGVYVLNRETIREKENSPNGFNQRNGPQFIWIDLTNPWPKPRLNVLIHEIGHFKWRNLGKDQDHSLTFYRLLKDALIKLEVKYTKLYDSNDKDLSRTDSPVSDPFDNICD